MATQHPAFERFYAKNRMQKVLLIWAPPILGVMDFAASWIAGTDGLIIDLSGQELGDAVGDKISDAVTTSERLAVILPADAKAYALAASLKVAVAGPRDLLINEQEYADWAQTIGTSIESTEVSELYSQVGGRYELLRMRLVDGSSESKLRQCMTSALNKWLDAQENAAELAAAGFLEDFSDLTLKNYYREFSEVAITREMLLNVALIAEDPAGKAWMPSWIAQKLRKRCWREDERKAAILDRRSIAVLADSVSLNFALKRAADAERWGALLELLNERWVELLYRSAWRLLKVVSSFPRHIMDSSGYLWHALTILKASVPMGMRAPIPAASSGIAYEHAALQLRKVAELVEHTPDARAINLRLLQMLFVRLNGRYEEAARLARQLKSLIGSAAAVGPISADLISYAHSQSGITLMMAGRLTESIWSLEESLRALPEHGRDAMKGYIYGKLALLHAFEGREVQAREYVSAFESTEVKRHENRGTRHDAILIAEGLLALSELDMATLDQIIKQLPEEPNQNYLWFFHVHLRAWSYLVKGDLPMVNRSISTKDSAWFLAAQNPLGRALFAEISRAAEALWPKGNALNGRHPLYALGLIRRGHPDTALAVLEKFDSTHLGYVRWASLGAMLMEAARSPEGPTEEFLSQIENCSPPISLLKLALISSIPSYGRISHSVNSIDSESARRIDAFISTTQPLAEQPPLLTEREVELIALLREGRQRKEIAAMTFRSENTIKSQLRGLYRKLEARGAKEALERARTLGY